MKVRKKKDGVTQCVLSETELNKLRAAYAVIDQLAYHYREDEFGGSCERINRVLDLIFADKELCGVKKVESAKVHKTEPTGPAPN